MAVEFLQPAGWPRPKGYANGVVAQGRTVFVSGMVGWDAQGNLAVGFAAQARQALLNIVAVLAEAGAGPAHIARLTWYVVDKRQYIAALHELGAAYREVLEAHYPAMTLVQVAGLVEDKAVVEIEATAVLPD